MQRWQIVIGAVFGAATLLAVVGLLFRTDATYFLCQNFLPFGIVISFGLALSTAFLGEGVSATATGTFGKMNFSAFATRGVAAFAITLVLLFLVRPQTCIDVYGLIQNVGELEDYLSSIDGSEDSARGYAMMAIGEVNLTPKQCGDLGDSTIAHLNDLQVRLTEAQKRVALLRAALQ